MQGQKPQTYFGALLDFVALEDFCISSTLSSAETEMTPHYHENPFVCFCIQGHYSEVAENTVTVVESGTSIFRGPKYEHSNRFFDDGASFLNIEINHPQEFAELNGLKLPEGCFGRLGTVEMYRLLYSFNQGHGNDFLNILCYEAVMKHFDMLPVSGSLDWISRVKERIYDSPHSSLSLSDLSTQFDLHPNYIIRKFREVTGYRLSEFLHRVRIENSLAMMTRSNANLTRIAMDSGYFDQSHFNRNFKKFLSVSPKNFRNSLKG